MDKDNDSGAPAAAPPSTVRQTISISLSKKPKKKVTSAKLQLSTPEEEYSTIAEHADALSRKRAEEGQVLVIPCQQTRDEGKPLLAQRSRTQDVSNEVATTTIDLLQKDDDDEATRQLIESATHRQDDETKQSSGLTIEAPRKNTLNTKAATSTATDDELFRRDLSNRAEDVDPTSRTYANISIKDFGGALLRGMGWEGGDTKKKEDEVKARPHRLGLGATPLLPPPTGKHGRARRPEELKRGEERMKAEEERERKRLEMEKLDVQYTLQIGSVVKIDGGRAKVIQTAGVPGLNRILVRMESGQEEAVSKGIVRLCSWDELEKYPFQEKRERHEERRGSDVRCNEKSKDGLSNDAKTNGHGRDEFSDDDRDCRRHKDSSRYCSDDNRHHEAKRKASSRDKYYSSDDDSRNKKRRKESRRGKYDCSDEERRHKRKKKESRYSGKRDRNEEERRIPKHHDRGERKRNKCTDSQEHINWLLPNIRIRIVSKKYCQHLQKGIVQDVMSSQNNNSKAVILLDNQEVLDNVPERYLETALPKTGGNVIVLEGVHRWKKGRLLERSSESGRGVIQLFDDLEVVEVSLDGVAEWCGPLDEDLE